MVVEDQPPAGYVKSILPCTPLAIVKCLEHTGVYNTILPYGDRAYGKTVTVINRSVSCITTCTSVLLGLTDASFFFRSEVVGRPLAALLANDGARVFSVDIDSVQVRPPSLTFSPSADAKKNRSIPNVRVWHPNLHKHSGTIQGTSCTRVRSRCKNAWPNPMWSFPPCRRRTIKSQRRG